jgi:hypothetical protein
VPVVIWNSTADNGGPSAVTGDFSGASAVVLATSQLSITPGATHSAAPSGPRQDGPTIHLEFTSTCTGKAGGNPSA